MQKNNILITGANGFVGSSLADYIIREHKLWVVHGVDKEIGREGNYIFDITNKEKLTALIIKIKPRYIFHFAGTTNQYDFGRLLFLNIYTTQILFEAIRSINKYNPRIFIPASAAEYGEVPPSQMPIKENCSLHPISLYGFSKMAQEELSLFYALKGSDVIAGRIFNIIGKGVPLHFSIGKFAYELALINKKKKKPILHTKSLSTKRDFLDIEDVCKYLVAVACYGKKGEVYNICRGESYKIRFLLNKLIDIAGIEDIRIVKNKECNRENNVIDSFGSNKKIKRIVKKAMLVSIDESLRNTYFYYLSKA